MKPSFMEKYGNIRVLGFVLFVLASIFCLYKIYDLQGKPSDAYKRPIFTTNLKLVNVIGRHGDRSPADGFPLGDTHGTNPDFFWPEGVSNLTELGRMRQFRIGLELRRRYRDFLSFNSSDYLAFSSAVLRCRESLNHILRGLFQIQWPTETGRKFVDMYNLEKNCLQPNASTNKTCQDRANRNLLYLPSGSGSPSEYKNIKIDSNIVPTLDWHYLKKCKYYIDHPQAVDKDLMASKAIANLKGISKLAELLKKKYKRDFDGEMAFLWTTIMGELALARTGQSVVYGDHFYSYINERVPGYKPESGITNLDLWAQMVYYYFRDRLTEKLQLIELGPIITSVVQSQKQALERRNNGTGMKSPVGPVGADNGNQFDSSELYANKKVILYSTHDSTLQSLMGVLNITNADGDFEARFNKWHRSDDVDKFLAGLKTIEFGTSLLFELYETEMKQREAGVWKTTKRFAHVQAALYNEEDVVFRPVAYKRLKLGSMCREKFKKIYKKTSNVKHLLKEQFYDEDFPLDTDYSCPFELFKNVTSEHRLKRTELLDLCEKK